MFGDIIPLNYRSQISKPKSKKTDKKKKKN